jgi:hypothetical protein
MTLKINGTQLTTQPSNSHWIERNQLGFDGNAHPVYVAPRQFEMSWDWMEADAFAQLIGFYQGCTGTMSVDLPMWNGSTGGYATYTGTLREPSYTSSFEGTFGSVKLLILNIR